MNWWLRPVQAVEEDGGAGGQIGLRIKVPCRAAARRRAASTPAGLDLANEHRLKIALFRLPTALQVAGQADLEQSVGDGEMQPVINCGREPEDLSSAWLYGTTETEVEQALESAVNNAPIWLPPAAGACRHSGTRGGADGRSDAAAYRHSGA